MRTQGANRLIFVLLLVFLLFLLTAIFESYSPTSTLTQPILPSNRKSMSIVWNASWFVKLSVCGTVTNEARGRASVVEPCSVLHVSGYGIYSLRGVVCG